MPTLVNLEHYLYFAKNMPVLRSKYVEATPELFFLGRGSSITIARQLLKGTYGMLVQREH